MKKKTFSMTALLLLVAMSGIYILNTALQSRSAELSDVRAEKFTSTESFQLEKKYNGLYQSRYTFVSDFLDPVFSYNAVGATWDGEIPDDTSLEIAVRSSQDDLWHVLEPEADGPSLEVYSTDLEFLSSPREKLQYRVLLETENPYRTPQISKLEVHYFDYARGKSDLKQAASLLNVLNADAANNDTFAPRIITRSEWGANENLRTYNESNPPAKIIKAIDTEERAKYADELVVIDQVNENENGDLTWPEQYPLKVSHFIIHHTAMTYPKDFNESVAKVRDIYYWHTIVKGWGDIGYNYLIDPFGNIFEGRAGSDKGVTGAHAAGSNIGSIGIAIMGNYQTCEQLYSNDSEEYLKGLAGDPEFASHDLSPETEQALVDLIAYKSALYNINPMGKSKWRGKIRSNILGHRDVRKTACPGENIYAKLPEIRAKAAQKYFQILPDITPLDWDKELEYKETRTSKSLYDLDISGVSKRITAKAGDTIKIPVRVKNTGNMDILKNSYFQSVHNYPALDIKEGEREQLDQTIKVGASSIFEIEIDVSSKANGSYTLGFYPMLNKRAELKEKQINLTLEVEGKSNLKQYASTNILAQLSDVMTGPKEETSKTNPDIRVRISKFTENKALLSSASEMTVYFGDDKQFTVDEGQQVLVTRDSAALKVEYGDETLSTAKPVRLEAPVLTVNNMQAPPAWNPNLNDNAFRDTLEFRSLDNQLVMINELKLEDYIKGVAEVPNGEPLEKNKTLAVIARGYAYQYLAPDNRKYPGKPYDASDDPQTFQKYLGYNFETRNADWQTAVQDTYGEMLTYDGKVVKTPYFNQSNGKTLSAEEVWGWTDTPWLQATPDPFCKGLEQKGHGVGLSGCGATEAAKRGKSYEEILTYYYKGVKLEKIY